MPVKMRNIRARKLVRVASAVMEPAVAHDRVPIWFKAFVPRKHSGI
jgi:hypothetical protein